MNEYELVLDPPARRAATRTLPEAVASAVVEFSYDGAGAGASASW